MELSDNHNPVKFRTALFLASYAVVFSVAPPLSTHKHLWGNSGGTPLKTAAYEATLFYTF